MSLNSETELELYNSLIDEFLPENSDSELFSPDLKISLCDSSNIFSNYSPEISSAKTHMSYNKTTFFLDSPTPYICEDLFTDNPCKLKIGIKKKNRIKKLVGSLLSSNLNSTSEISYSLLYYVLYATLLKKKCSFIHSSMFAKDGIAYAFVGTGGSGKTSLLFSYLNSNDDYKYVCEDFGIIDSEGYVYFSPKTASIYSSDIDWKFKKLTNIFQHMNKFSKCMWFIHKNLFRRNPMFKTPTYLFSDVNNTSQNRMPLDVVIYIVRGNYAFPMISQINANDIAERITNVTFREHKKLIEILNLIKSNEPKKYEYPSIIDLYNATKNIYHDGLTDTKRYLLEVPFTMSPEEIQQYLAEKNIISIE